MVNVSPPPDPGQPDRVCRLGFRSTGPSVLIRVTFDFQPGRRSGQHGEMLGHLGINVADLAVARAYYERLLPHLGFDEFLSRSDEFAYRPANGKPGTYLFFYPATADPGATTDADDGADADADVGMGGRPGLQHLAFIVPTRAAVSEAYRLALSLGSESVHEPQDWFRYPPPYHAAFWRDPFGLMLEAVCHHDR